MTTETFTSPRGLTQAYAQIRGDIAELNGLPRTARFRLRPGTVTLLQHTGTAWIRVTSDGMDEIRYRVANGGTFRLTAGAR